MIEFCAGSGKFHTNNPNTKKPKPLLTLSYQAIQQHVDNPSNIPDKHEGYWVIPSTLLSRINKEQEENGAYFMLWADIDKNPHDFDNLPDVTNGCQFEMYTTKTATEENQKARILIPLNQAINGSDFSLYQEIFNDKLRECGIEPDPKNCGYNQIFYTPNRGEIYKTNSQREGGLFDPVSAWGAEIAEKKAIIKQQEIEIEERTRLKATYAPIAGDTPINNFNRSHTVESVLLSAGYKQRGNKFCHPDSETGNYAASVNDDNRVMTVSTKDKLYSDGQGHDAFSAFCVLFHGGNESEAIKATIGDTVSDWKEELKQAVAEINKTHSMVTVGDKLRVMEEINNDYEMRQLLTFKGIYNNKKIITGVKEDKTFIYSKLGNVWSEHPDRRTYKHGIHFLPMSKPLKNGGYQSIEHKLNMWTGWNVDPIDKINIDVITHYLYQCVCSGNDEYYSYLLGWLAYGIQHPELMTGVVLVLKGDKASGKTTLAKIMGKIYGKHLLEISDSKHLTGAFNSHLRECCFLCAEEAIFAGNKEQDSLLKHLITSDRIIVEYKGVDAFQAVNRINIMMTSNSEQVHQSGRDERRFFGLFLPKRDEFGRDYFNNLYEKIEGDKLIGGFLHFLLTMDLSFFTVRDYPETEENKQQRELSLDTIPRFLLEACERGYLVPHISEDNKWHPYDDGVPSLVTIELILEGLIEWEQETNQRRQYKQVTRQQISKYLTNLGIKVLDKRRNCWNYSSKTGIKIEKSQKSAAHLGEIEYFEMLVRNFEKL